MIAACLFRCIILLSCLLPWILATTTDDHHYYVYPTRPELYRSPVVSRRSLVPFLKVRDLPMSGIVHLNRIKRIRDQFSEDKETIEFKKEAVVEASQELQSWKSEAMQSRGDNLISLDKSPEPADSHSPPIPSPLPRFPIPSPPPLIIPSIGKEGVHSPSPRSIDPSLNEPPTSMASPFNWLDLDDEKTFESSSPFPVPSISMEVSTIASPTFPSSVFSSLEPSAVPSRWKSALAKEEFPDNQLLELNDGEPTGDVLTVLNPSVMTGSKVGDSLGTVLLRPFTPKPALFDASLIEKEQKKLLSSILGLQVPRRRAAARGVRLADRGIKRIRLGEPNHKVSISVMRMID